MCFGQDTAAHLVLNQLHQNIVAVITHEILHVELATEMKKVSIEHRFAPRGWR
jgi:hypothetical protein